MVRLSMCKQMRFVCLAFGLVTTFSSSLFAFFVDGSGHYGLRGITIVDPASAPNRGMHQAIDQSFRLEGEVRTGDSASFFMEFRLFPDPQNAYLGDTGQPSTCYGAPYGDDNAPNPKCTALTQSTTSPGYEWLRPKVTKLYMRYAFDYCILEAGRRPRDWGLGIFLDSGKDPFSLTSSTFDGISCNINLQKFQDLGFTVGYDKLAETGRPIRSNPNNPVFGPSNRSDDINQYYLSIEFDDRKTRPNSFFNKQIGIYAANIKSGAVKSGGLNTDLTIADLYLGFYFPNVTFRNEFLFWLGTTADPNVYSLGGAQENSVGEIATNKLSAIGIAGSLEFLIAGPSVSSVQPYIGMSGSRHTTFFEYAIAPGDKQGYFNDPNRNSTLAVTKRNQSAGAMAFDANFTPGLILFNGRSQINDLKIDGIFDPKKVMNAQVYSLGYRFENKDYGNVEPKIVSAYLIQTPPDEVTAFYANVDKKPVGYYGRSLGYEVDVKYWKAFAGGIEAGVASGVLFPGLAWQVNEEQKPLNSYIFQAQLVYNF